MNRIFSSVFRTLGLQARRRSIEAFRAPLHVTVGTHDSTATRQESELADRYFAAFASGRRERLDRIRHACQELDGGPIVVSMFNWGYRQLVENWVASCDQNSVDCRKFTLLFPTDRKADSFARTLGFRTAFADGMYGEIPVEANDVFGDQKFRRIMFAKLAMTKDMLDLGYDILRQDVDMVWLRDPRHDLARRAARNDLDMLFMFDGPNPHYKPLHYNSGFVFIRSNEFTRHAWDMVFGNYLKILSLGGEQRLINAVMNALHERGLKTDRLPEEVYVNGHVISRAINRNIPIPEDPAVLHFSWTSDIGPKLEHMKRFGFWYL